MKNDYIVNSNRVHTAGELDIEIAMLDVKGNLHLMLQQIVFNLSKIYFDISTSFIGSRKKKLNCDEKIGEKKIIAAKYATYAVAKMVIILSG